MRRTILTTIAFLGALAAPAGAATTITATPNKAGAATVLRYDVDTAGTDVVGRIPSGLKIAAPAGFRIDNRAVPRRCSKLSATLNECPKLAKIGSGTLYVTVTAPMGTDRLTRGLTMYMGSKPGTVWAVVKVFGTRSVPGTIDREGGVDLSFDPLPELPTFDGQVAYQLDRITLTLGGRQLVVKGKGGKRKKVRRNVLYAAKACTGSWDAGLTLGFPDGTSTAFTAPVACR